MLMAYLEITLQINADNRAVAVEVYKMYKQPFLSRISGAKSKELLVREDDVQVLHGFGAAADAKAYLESAIFNDNVVVGLKPLLAAAPEIRIYEVA
jgi:hypothetical protein